MEHDVGPIQPPIFLGSPGCKTYLSIPEAEVDIEVPDVDESPLYDATGRKLRAIGDEETWTTRIVAAGETAGQREELAAYLRSSLDPHPKTYLARSGILERLGVTKEWLASASVDDLVARAMEVELAWRARPTLLRRFRWLLGSSRA